MFNIGQTQIITERINVMFILYFLWPVIKRLVDCSRTRHPSNTLLGFLRVFFFFFQHVSSDAAVRRRKIGTSSELTLVSPAAEAP